MMTMLTKVLANENSYDKNPEKPIVVGGVVFPDQVSNSIIINILLILVCNCIIINIVIIIIIIIIIIAHDSAVLQ